MRCATALHALQPHVDAHGVQALAVAEPFGKVFMERRLSRTTKAMRLRRLAPCQNPRMTTLYGIPNCDTVKKARAWLSEHGFEHSFHDFKKQGVPQPGIDRWLARVGWERLLNRKGTTWRGLDEATKARCRRRRQRPGRDAGALRA
jgi:hypothetical protein